MIESVIKALLDSAATGEIALFFAGILFCLWSLAHYLRFFEKWDDLMDLMREIKQLLMDLNRIKNNKLIQKRLERGEDVTEEL